MSTVRYPSEFQAAPNTDYLEIKVIRKDYAKNTYVMEPLGDGLPDTLLLNIPQKVMESVSANWRNTKLGEIGPFLGNADGTGQLGGKMIQNVIQRFLENAYLGSAVDNAVKLGASGLNENGILSATNGVVYNPNMEVLYDGPDFRTFRFQFSLFSKSEKDAKAIYKIVRFFQRSSVPSTQASIDGTALAAVILDNTGIEGISNIASTVDSTITGVLGALGRRGFDPDKLRNAFNGLINNSAKTATSAAQGAIGAGLAAGKLIFSPDQRFIKQPPFLLLTYKRGPDVHPFIQPLLPAAMSDLSIDYSPTGNYTVVDNFGQSQVSTVVAVNISISLTELKNVFREDYSSNFANRAIGITSPAPGGSAGSPGPAGQATSPTRTLIQGTGNFQPTLGLPGV
jgi:hypothetical protein